MSETPPAETAADPAIVCKHPDCDRPRRPKGAKGGVPEYCDLATEEGAYLHTPGTAYRARLKAEKEAARGDGAPDPLDQADLSRPVTMATTRGAMLRDEIAADVATMSRSMGALADRLTAVMGELERIVDPAAAEAQIDAVQTEAAEQVAAAAAELARKSQRLVTAETAAEQAREAAEEMDEQLSQAEAARAAAEERTAAALAEVAATTEITREQIEATRAAASELVATVRAEAAEQIAAAIADAEAQIEDARRAAAADVAAALLERDEARAEAARQTGLATAAVTKAETEIAHARQGESDARDQITQIRAEMGERLAELRTTHEARVAELVQAVQDGRDRSQRAEKDRDRFEDRLDKSDQLVADLQDQLAQARAELAAAPAPPAEEDQAVAE